MRYTPTSNSHSTQGNQHEITACLDELTLPEALVFIDKVVDDVDIIEVGTPFLIREGVNAIKVIKEKYPHKEVLVDAKIMDGVSF